jgi:hypothetical protein
LNTLIYKGGSPLAFKAVEKLVNVLLHLGSCRNEFKIETIAKRKQHQPTQRSPMQAWWDSTRKPELNADYLKIIRPME